MIDRPLYTDRIMKFADSKLIKIITGVRRSGKSTILKLVIDRLKTEMNIDPDHILFYRFDSMEFQGMDSGLMFQKIKGEFSDDGRYYVFLDEVQEIENWEKVVNSIFEDFNVDIYVTGSNSKLMSSEISTYLTGRYVQFHVLPLSFSEYMEFKASVTDVKDPQIELNNYAKMGGFPAIHLQNFSVDEAYSVVRDLYDATIYADIIKRSQIKKIDQFERIVKYAFENVGNTFSAKSLADYLKSEQRTISAETVYSYLEKLERAFLLYRCPRFDLQGKEILKTQEKFYLADVAFRHSLLGYRPDNLASDLENIIYLELLRRGYSVYVGKLKNYEVDFVATKPNDRLYVQVSQTISDENTAEREFSRLLGIEDNYPKYVVTTDPLIGGNYNGIHTMHIADFLLCADY